MILKPHDDPEVQRKICRSIANTEYLNIWEGSIRSGKTVAMILAWLKYLEDTPIESQFIISGRTVATVEKNLVYGDKGIGILGLVPGAIYKHVGESRAVLVPTSHGIKTCYVVGASDIKAYQAIRGMSAGGWLADEINMHNRDFVQECFNRTALSTDRRHFYSLNPDNPNAWIYKDPSIGIDRFTSMTPEEKKEVGGVRWWHFTPMDNPVMTPERLKQLSMQYTGFAYDRYILGKRCVAEGLVYPSVSSEHFVDFDIKDVDVRYCAIDFGTDHPTVMVFGGIYKGNKMDWRIVAEYFDKGSNRTTADYYAGFLDVCAKLDVDPQRIVIAIDPAAKALRVEFLKHRLSVVKAKNDVMQGINFTRSLIYNHLLTFYHTLTDILAEFGSYTWDPRASERGEDKPIKINDDRMDAVRYFAYTHIQPVIGMKAWEIHR